MGVSGGIFLGLRPWRCINVHFAVNKNCVFKQNFKPKYPKNDSWTGSGSSSIRFAVSRPWFDSLAKPDQNTLKVGIHSFMGIGSGGQEGPYTPRIFIIIQI